MHVVNVFASVVFGMSLSLVGLAGWQGGKFLARAKAYADTTTTHHVYLGVGAAYYLVAAVAMVAAGIAALSIGFALFKGI